MTRSVSGTAQQVRICLGPFGGADGRGIGVIHLAREQGLLAAAADAGAAAQGRSTPCLWA